MEDGKLKLSVYAQKQNQFSEVVVDHASGAVAKTEEIKERDDLAAAKAQSEAMARARRTLASAVAKAVSGNAGYRAVSVTSSSMAAGRSRRSFSRTRPERRP